MAGCSQCIYMYIGCKPELQMMYAGSKTGVVKEGGFTKVTSVHQRRWLSSYIPPIIIHVRCYYLYTVCAGV